MLSNDAIFSAMGFAEQYDLRNIILKPLPGSPLHHLTEASGVTSDMACKLENGDVSIDFYRIEQAANAKEASFDQSRHNYAMDDFRDVAVKSILGQLNLFRTVIAPRINELMELVTMRLTNAPISDLTKLEIVEDEDCPAIYGTNMRKLVDQYANYPASQEPRLSIAGPKLSTAEILKYVETGVASIDAELLPWAAALPEYQIQYAYESFFTLYRGQEDDRGFYGRMDKSVANMALVYCIARHLIENDVVLEGAEGSLAEYRQALKEIMAQSAHLLAVQMENNDAAIKNGNMVRSIAGTQIKVFAPVYREWLKNGGEPEVLYGMAVSNKPRFTIDAITDELATYMAAWNNYSSMVSSRDSAMRYNYLREQLALAYESLLNKPNEAGEMPEPTWVKEQMDCFRKNLNNITIKEIDDLHGTCRKLVCRTSFADSPAEVFLTKMDEEAARNPKLTPRECGALATIWYINSWVAAMIIPGNP